MNGYLLQQEIAWLRQWEGAQIIGVYAYPAAGYGLLLRLHGEKTVCLIRLAEPRTIYAQAKPAGKPIKDAHVLALHRLLKGYTLRRIQSPPLERYLAMELDPGPLVLLVSLIPQKPALILYDQERRLRWANRYTSLDTAGFCLLPGQPVDLAYFQAQQPASLGQVAGPLLERCAPTARPALDRLASLTRFYIYAQPYHLSQGPRFLILPCQKDGASPVDTGDINAVLARADGLVRRYMPMHERVKALRRSLKTRLKKAKRKLLMVGREAAEADKHATYRLYGEILKAHLGTLTPGMGEVVLPDFSGENHTISLNPALSPVENMAFYFNLAKKMARSQETRRQNVAAAGRELAEIQEAYDSVQAITTIDALECFYQELGPERPDKDKKKRGPKAKSFRLFVTPKGYRIMVANSAKANDELTFHIATPSDIWLHAQNIHGSHVVIRNPYRNREVPQDVLLRAAILAARFSKAKHSSLVPVDYTEKRYVRKPRNSPRGFVTYTHHKTLMVDPAEAGI